MSFLNFCLPSELEWVRAATLFDWEFPYKKGPKPEREKANTYNSKIFKVLNVDDENFGANCFGLYHMGGNVMEMTRDWHYTSGHFGFNTDGAYYIAKGGNYGHCSFSAGVARRIIIDVVDRSTRIGFRLICLK